MTFILIKIIVLLALTCFIKINAVDHVLRFTSLRQKNAKEAPYPVVLVPGDGGSQFEGKINKSERVRFFCEEYTKDWFSLWLNLELIAPMVLDCFVDNMRLIYDPKTGTTRNNDGVQTRQPGFGNTSSVEWLDPSQMFSTYYFYYMAESLVTAGLKKDISIRGAPYDFRKAPNEMKSFINDLQHLIEDTYVSNGHKRVVVIGHSMGNPYILYLLNRQSQAWKDKYIQSFVSLAGPWAGAAKSFRLMASGDDLDVIVVNSISARPLQRSLPSSAWLMPYSTIWGKDEVIGYGPDTNYTVSNYKKFFDDINFPDGYLMRKQTENLGLHALVPPGVEVHCLYGSDVQTPLTFSWKKGYFPDSAPTTKYGKGDGTVNERSLKACMKWKNQQKKDVIVKDFPKASHMSILYDKRVLEYINNIILGKK